MLRRAFDPRRETQLPPQPPGRGPNGRPFCRRCGAEVPRGSRTWCGQVCIDAYTVTTWPGACAAVAKRDTGVCAGCGLDTVALRAAFRAWLEARLDTTERSRLSGRSWRTGLPESWRWAVCAATRHAADEWCAFHGVPRNRQDGPRWYDVDHIRPVADGGTNALENLRTLCIRCHRATTAAWQTERAAARAVWRKGARQLDILEANT